MNDADRRRMLSESEIPRSDDEFFPVLEMARIVNIFRHSLTKSGRMKPFEDLTNTNNIIIFMVKNSKRNVYQRDIERKLGITRSAASKSVNILVDKGYIVREKVNTDARLKKLSLTDKAKSILDSIDIEHEKIERVLLDGFTEDEKDQFQRFLRRAEENLKYR